MAASISLEKFFLALIDDWTETHVPHIQPIRYGKSCLLHAHSGLPLLAPSAPLCVTDIPLHAEACEFTINIC